MEKIVLSLCSPSTVFVLVKLYFDQKQNTFKSQLSAVNNR